MGLPRGAGKPERYGLPSCCAKLQYQADCQAAMDHARTRLAEQFDSAQNWPGCPLMSVIASPNRWLCKVL